MALDWLPIVTTPPRRRQTARSDQAFLFTAVTIPVPQILNSLTFFSSEGRSSTHRHLTRISTLVQEPYSPVVVFPVSWLPIEMRRTQFRHIARGAFVTTPTVASVWVPAMGLVWHPQPSPAIHHQRSARGEIVETIVPSLINTAAALGCLEIAGGDLTVAAFVQESVTVTDFVQESLASTTLIDGEFC